MQPSFTSFFLIIIVSIFLYLLYRFVLALESLSKNAGKVEDRLTQIDETLRILSARVGDAYEDYRTIQEDKVLNTNFDHDELLEDAKNLLKDSDVASASLIQRKLQIGYARAARILDELETEGIVGPARGSKPREVLLSKNGD